MADRHKAAFGGGGTRSGGSELWGIGFTAEWNPGHHVGRRDRTWGVALDLNQVAGLHARGDDGTGTEFSRWTGLIGPRLTFSNAALGRFQPFVNTLIGLGYERGVGGDPATSFAWAFGGGIDIVVKNVTDRSQVALRLQYGYQGVEGDWSEAYSQWTGSVVLRVE
jgi:hypothetical protein